MKNNIELHPSNIIRMQISRRYVPGSKEENYLYMYVHNKFPSMHYVHSVQTCTEKRRKFSSVPGLGISHAAFWLISFSKNSYVVCIKRDRPPKYFQIRYLLHMMPKLYPQYMSTYVKKIISRELKKSKQIESIILH